MRSTTRHIIIAILACLPCVGSLASGYFMVSNFSKEQYTGGSQNWCMVQDIPGKVYFGNRDGLLMYDGSRWKKAYLGNYTTVRSLMFDSETNRIYAGGSEELGFFSNDSQTGNFIYTSLLNYFPSNRPAFSEIWNIYKLDGNIWFQADNYMFCLSGNNISVYPIDGRISTSALIGQNLYVALEDGRIEKLSNGGFYPLKDSYRLEGKRIVTILPYGRDGEMIVGTTFDGLFRFDGENFSPFHTDINPFLSDNQLFCGNCKDARYIFGTVNNGAVMIDFATGETHYLNKETGLQNNTVLAANFDCAGNIWLCLDNGIDYALCNSPVNKLIGSNKSIGAGYCSVVTDGSILYGTNQGLYATVFPYPSSPTPPTPVQKVHGQIWDINFVNNRLLVSSDAGIFHYRDGEYKHISGSHGTYFTAAIPNLENAALASTYDGFRLLRFEAGEWIDDGAISGCNDLVGRFLFDQDGTLWIAHWRKGIYHLRPDFKHKTLKIIHLYNRETGLPSDENNTLAFFDGRVIFSTRDGFFSPDSIKPESIVGCEDLNKALGDKHQGALQSLPDGSLAYVDQSGVYIASKRTDGKIICRQIASRKIVEDLIPGYTNLNLLSPNEFVISTQDGFSTITRNEGSNTPWRPQPFISAVYANQDTLVYYSPINSDTAKTITLPFDLNSLKFEFAYPEFESGTVEYSSYLENYESDWSQFSPESSREYTRLSEGDYTMRIRVRDSETGEMKEAAFNFSITPPWFRSMWAKIFYFIGILLFLALSTAAIKNRIDHARTQTEKSKEKEFEVIRKQSEQEALVKDYEIASLKTERLEQDIQHKSRELSVTTMNLIHKNEILSDIAAQLTALQQLALSDSSSRALISRSISKLQNSVEKSLSGDNDWGTFSKNFDIVYTDYTKKLNQLYPSLTTADKRLCCYIRMGLSSKEIAPLINISYKSVEMARYRLRKKMNLPTETSLTDYLTSL